MELPKITIYTDGACKGNPGLGGWAAILMQDVNGEIREKIISGSHAQTTNNIMELTAVAEGLESLKKPCRVEVHSDSAYIVNAFSQRWVDQWQRNGWKTAQKKPVKNRELWERIIRQTTVHRVIFKKVKGHAGDHYNERVDALANRACETLILP
jgi:ribonuclease HI